MKNVFMNWSRIFNLKQNWTLNNIFLKYNINGFRNYRHYNSGATHYSAYIWKSFVDAVFYSENGARCLLVDDVYFVYIFV